MNSTNDKVRAWAEDIIIPTYPVGTPEKNPMFLEKRVYQGSSGVVYPHAVIEKIYDQKTNKSYKAVFLENEYIKIMVLPEIGGRIQMAYDKVKQRHFIYYNQVIKPALVGLTGPWISGGIEFNWPQHHRPSTFEPVDFTIIENDDGSKTIWVNEVERMSRTKGMAGFTLYPGKAFIEIQGKLYNRTPFPQTFLWWANPAVKVNDAYQSVFPPDVHAVFDHGKRDVSSFPIAKGEYYKVDYSPGTDISRYKNIPVPTSYMAVSSKYNFVGGYEHDTGGGLLHIADHHISPGKKQWTWGNGEFGQAWDRNLTDEDGPYVELMTGVYTDNQPDFSWLQPYEEKTFVQYFMPYSEAGIVKNASKEAVVNIDINGRDAEVKLYVTSKFERLRISLVKKETVLFSETISCSPECPYIRTVSFAEQVIPEDVNLTVTDLATGNQLISYQPEIEVEKEIPSPASAAKKPKEVESNEQLYLTGLHLEQYRHATYVATDYYEEALRRDPKDARNNNALGLWLLRRGKFEQAEPYFKRAISTLTQRNPNPYDGEPHYNLGWCLKLQGRHDEAFDAFYKAIWSDAWQHAGYLNLARIACLKKNNPEALQLIQKSLLRNYHSHSTRHLKAVILRKLNKKTEAASLIQESLEIDPFNFGCLFEKYLITEDLRVRKELELLSRNWVHNFIEYALDYAHAGLYDEAIQLISLYIESTSEQYTLIPYYLGWFYFQSGDLAKATAYFREGAGQKPDFVFPNRIEEVAILQTAIQLNPSDYYALYYLGNFWYDRRQYDDAIQCWEKSVELNPVFPTTCRNLALAYYNKLNDPDKALLFLEKAFANDPTDARVLMELDQLYKKLNRDHSKRLEFLENHLDLVMQRDDLYLERITLYNQTGNYRRSKELIAAHKFHPWEGGEGKVVGQYHICHLELAKQAIEAGEFEHAILLLDEAETYPENLGEGKLTGAQENDIHYWKGVAWEMIGNSEEAIANYKLATLGISVPGQAIFYNDAQPDKILYQGLAWIQLGEREKATEIFQRLINFGEKHLQDVITIDYFAVSLPDLLVFDADLTLRNKIHCLYLMALGKLGLGNGHLQEADQLFEEIIRVDANHQGAKVHKQMMNNTNHRKPLLMKICKLIILILCYALPTFAQTIGNRVDLSGTWRFQADPDDIGQREQWFNKKLNDKVALPGSMTTNNKGDEIAVNTSWTGSIFDSSWFTKGEYAKYRQPGNIKVPFWLQPVKHYKGAAWYQKDINIPVGWNNKHVELYIERSHWETTVWIDDQLMGMQNSLSTAQVFNVSAVKPGNHRVTIRVDNRVKDMDVGPNSHSISDHTQSNWNGMIGQLSLNAKPLVYIDHVELFPNIRDKNVRVRILVRNGSGNPVKTSFELIVISNNPAAQKLRRASYPLDIAGDSMVFQTTYSMGNSPLLWDEFQPNLYTMEVKLGEMNSFDERKIQFGMSEFRSGGTQFTVNGRKTFLRGTLECAIFPLTGYPPTDVRSWTDILKVARSYGLNHIRFHSWCPPEAAFDAADRVGMYLQVECASWANQGATIGDGGAIDQYIYDESNRIVRAYGNHPSFCMMTYGNEPGGRNHSKYLASFLNYWKQKDPRRVYTSGAGWPVISENDFHNIPEPRIQHWLEGVKSIINKERPATTFDWSKTVDKYNVPVVSHEIGQWCVYPDFKEMKKYTGVLKPKNFEIFRDRLKENGLLHLADSFLLASGKLQTLCYKADIEAALRTKNFGGFQLLDLHDFPGQGTALVGVLSPFWTEKGYVTGKAFSKFCNTTVPLARFPKMVYLNNESLEILVEIAHFGPNPLDNIIPTWEIKGDGGKVLMSGKFSSISVPVGNAIRLGEIKQSLTTVRVPAKLKLYVTAGAYQNSWDFFVYPVTPPAITGVTITEQFDEKVINQLNEGGKVLLTLKKGSVKNSAGGSIAVGFSSIFWNTAWTNGQAPHTLGILVNPKHPAFNYFPTDYHSNYQWWDAMSHSNVVMLDAVAKGLKPIVRVIDDWVTANSLGLVFECRVGKGKLLVSSIDLLTDKENRPEARQLTFSLVKYMESREFNPTTTVSASRIQDILVK